MKYLILVAALALPAHATTVVSGAIGTQENYKVSVGSQIAPQHQAGITFQPSTKDNGLWTMAANYKYDYTLSGKLSSYISLDAGFRASYDLEYKTVKNPRNGLVTTYPRKINHIGGYAAASLGLEFDINKDISVFIEAQADTTKDENLFTGLRFKF